jgi:hypothetical protein
MLIGIEKLPLNYLPFIALNNQRIFGNAFDEYFASIVWRLHPNGFMMRSNQTRGMYGLRRGVEYKATVKTEAAVT